MKLSIVDVSPVLPGQSRHQTFNNTIELAQHAERLGYSRIWVAEHHGAASIAGRAPEVLIPVIAANTSTIKVGSGSILLNHYSPFKVAEVFCTLNELFPGRIDLGAGRATTGPVTDFALQQERNKQVHNNSDQQIAELVAWLDNSFPSDHPFAKAPIATLETRPDLHLLGSSPWSAMAASELGLRYVFAGFINQQGAVQNIHHYRTNFKPAQGHAGVQKPEAILAVHVVCADTEEEAARLLAPVHVMYRNLTQGRIDAMMLSAADAINELGAVPVIEKYINGSGIPPKFIAGTFASVKQQLIALTNDLDLEELIIQDLVIDHKARLHSYELLSGLIGEL
ncbi:MAG: MsnO8 family LLM class oxidoreductase [Bacteroidota bacterium]